MSAKPQSLFTEATAQTLEQQLDQLAALPKGHTLRALIERLRPRIKAAQAAGYTYEEMVSTLEAGGVHITSNTLKQYLREPRTAVETGKELPSPTEFARATKRGPLTTVTAKVSQQQPVAQAPTKTDPLPVSPPAPTPLATAAPGLSAPASAQAEPSEETTVIAAATSQTEDKAQTVPATHTQTLPKRLTHTNGQGFQEMRSDDDL